MYTYIYIYINLPKDIHTSIFTFTYIYILDSVVLLCWYAVFLLLVRSGFNTFDNN